jgi:hypothetical protein
MSTKLQDIQNNGYKASISIKSDNKIDFQYKAMKYHYKIQNELHKIQQQGKIIPNGYEQYLNRFDM